MRVLVTGGAGAIGSHLVEALLARGDRVGVLDSFHDFYPRVLKERNLEASRGHAGFAGLWECDIRDRERVAACLTELRPEGVVHLAARGGPAQHRSAARLRRREPERYGRGRERGRERRR